MLKLERCKTQYNQNKTRIFFLKPLGRNTALHRTSDVEAHCSFESGGHYRKPFKNIFRNIKFTHPTFSSTYLSMITERAMNDAME